MRRLAPRGGGGQGAVVMRREIAGGVDTWHRRHAAIVDADVTIPIEKHEVIDHLWGAAAIAAPFVLGYWKRSPRVAMMHVMAGASSILSALFTDYRSASRSSGRRRRRA